MNIRIIHKSYLTYKMIYFALRTYVNGLILNFKLNENYQSL